MNAAITLGDLEAGYRGHVVLHDLSLEIDEGECVAITGNNGSGKSTLIKALIGTVPHMNGTVEFAQGGPSDDYLREIGQRIVSLATTYSPHTARRQFNELLVYYAPEAYAEASARWYSLAGRIEESQVSSVF